jgi:hypothetical protein
VRRKMRTPKSVAAALPILLDLKDLASVTPR